MDKNFQEEQCTGVIKFTPPLYKQRYQFVKDLVGKYKPKKVADLGCADCTLLWMLKSYNCIEVLAGLDICASVMKEKMHRLYPLPGDYLQPAERSLTVTLHHGSVAHEDPCMLGFDLVTCIELALDAAKRYDYSVEFTGVGNPPTGVEDVGFCTQIAVFVKKYPQTSEPAQSKKPTEAAYKTVFKAVYPSLKDEKYLQNAVVTEVMFTAHVIKRSLLDHLVSEQENYNDDPTERKLQLQRSVNCFSEDLETLAVEKSVEPLTNGSVVYIPLRKIFSFPKVNRLCGTFEKLCELITGKVTLSSDGSAVVLNTEHENEEN
ncbi:small RNA 2'-O-methyltransferase isoform X2 [Anser cygnoides]|uniref:small RNA 2'-O-methyltransferase isoform X2 n=1 Tax=Anser cygnoides TaxID=8845 RepID=UPI0034D1903E